MTTNEQAARAENPMSIRASRQHPPVALKGLTAQVGWLGQTGRVYGLDEPIDEPGGFFPLYIEVENRRTDLREDLLARLSDLDPALAEVAHDAYWDAFDSTPTSDPHANAVERGLRAALAAVAAHLTDPTPTEDGGQE